MSYYPQQQYPRQGYYQQYPHHGAYLPQTHYPPQNAGGYPPVVVVQPAHPKQVRAFAKLQLIYSLSHANHRSTNHAARRYSVVVLICCVAF